MFTPENLQAFFQFIVAIASLIIIHEIGHFVAARLVGIEIVEFGIGFPPRILTLFEAAGTKYSLNWIPLGGFVRPKGADDPDVPGGLANANPWARIVFFFAGSTTNFLAGLLLYSIVFFQLGEPIPDEILVTRVVSSSPADIARIQKGDLITAIDGEHLDNTQELIELVAENRGKEIEVTYSHGEEVFTVSLIPREEFPPDEGPMGIQMTNLRSPINAGEALSLGAKTVSNQVYSIVTLPGRLIGYKGMYDIYSYFRGLDEEPVEGIPAGMNTLSFFATISVSLGLINLLPIPAFDGGRILFTLPEIVIRKRIPPIYETIMNMIGLGLLLLSVLYANLQDFINPVSFP